MEPADLELRLRQLQAEMRSGLDALQHGQRMQGLATGQRFEADLAQIRRDLSALAAKMAPLAEVQELRLLIKSGAASPQSAGPSKELAELVPRLMSELARLREESQQHGEGGRELVLTEVMARIEAWETDASRRLEELRELSARDSEQRVGQLRSALAAEFEPRFRELEGLQGEIRSGLESLADLPKALGDLRSLIPEAPDEASRKAEVLGEVESRLEAEAARRASQVQALKDQVDSALAGLPGALEELQGQVRGLAPGLEGVRQRLEELEGASARLQAAPGTPAAPEPAALEGLLRRLEALEARAPQAGSLGLAELEKRLASAEGLLAGLGSEKRPGPVEGAPASEAVAALARRLEALETGRGAEAPDLGALVQRLEVLEAGRSGEAAGLKTLARRVETVERQLEDTALAMRVETLERGVGAERGRMREVFGDLLEEHDLLLRRLESRLALLVQNFHRLSEEMPRRPIRPS